MGQVAVTLNGRTYRLVCGDGEEPRLAELANHVKNHVEKLAREFGQAGDERLLLMAALLVADELWEARAELKASTAKSPASPKGTDQLRKSGAA